MLNRMYELAEQSANGTFEDGTDRKQLQKEVDQLKSEINRIADSANFNGIKLLNGDMYAGQINSLSKTAANSSSAVDLLISADAYRTEGGATKNFTFKVTQGQTEGVTVATSGVVTITVNAKKTDGNEYSAADIAALLSNATISDGANKDAMAEALKNATVSGSGISTSKSGAPTVNGTAKKTYTGDPLTLQIGDTSDSFNQLKVGIKDCHVDALGLTDMKIGDQDSAAKALDKIKSAINYVSDVRGTLGATQNRLDHTINNLSVMQENIQDAESTIRDTDVADEMMAYTKNNILIQSAQAMLAQANQVPQGVLQLLQ